ncbi:MAG: hypothetical protein CME19_23445 [Gemmatimonadetes bacterium]|nr:hypothetical protein [Gemmatimonadota bacterium]
MPGIDLHPAGRVIDLGFTAYVTPSDLGLTNVPKGDLVLDTSASKYTVRPTRSRKARHYAYLAQAERVIDGDTLLLDIHPSIGAFFRERVRLHGIDTPEIATAEGKRAKS